MYCDSTIRRSLYWPAIMLLNAYNFSVYLDFNILLTNFGTLKEFVPCSQ